MFTYCGNNPVMYTDDSGFAFVPYTLGVYGRGKLCDYVIYYSHEQSSSNLEDPARQNHSASESYFLGVSSFDELATAINNTPRNVDNVYVYLHGDENNLSFYYAQYYSADSIADSFNEMNIDGSIYLFSCKGDRGDLASTMASTTNCTVIASIYKVSFDNGAARCGWGNYLRDAWYYGAHSWYCFYPDGRESATSFFGFPHNRKGETHEIQKHVLF